MKGQFIICRASAGSGKTYRLTMEYLKIVLGGRYGTDDEKNQDEMLKRMRSVLAITFTNKATNEMKTRIVEYVQMLIDGRAFKESDSMGFNLLKELNETEALAGHPIDRAALQQRARVFLNVLLHHYSDLSVSTIDSFMHRVVRTFAHDLNLPLGFDVMVDQNALIDQSVDELMQLVGTDGHEGLTRVVTDYARRSMEDGKGTSMERGLKALASQLFDEAAVTRLKALKGLSIEDYEVLRARLQKENREFEKQVCDNAAGAMQLLASKGINEGDCYRGKTGFYGYFNRLKDKLESPEPNSYVQKSFAEGNMAGSKASPSAIAALDEIKGRLAGYYDRITDLVTGKEMVAYNTRKLLLANLSTTALLDELNDVMQGLNAENEVVHISEFNRLINEQVSDQPAPFIYERLGNRYSHFLIDEFQDTSILQWHNMLPLLDNGVSGGNMSLVVGDSKQAIYRFRQGDVRQFIRLPRVEGTQHGESLSVEGNYRFMELLENRRSAQAIVEFNNAFFEWAAQQFDADSLVRQVYIGDGKRPAVEQDKFKPIKGYVELNGYMPADKEEKTSDILARYSELIYQKIVELHDRHNYRYRDIMIVTRYNKELTVFSEYLKQQGLQVITAESALISSSHAVMAIVAAMRHVHNPADAPAVAELVWRLVALGKLDGFLADDFIGRNDFGGLGEWLEKANPMLRLNVPYLSSLGLYDLCEEIVRELDLGDVDITYVASFLNKVGSYVRRYPSGLGEFLDWFDEQGNLSVTTSDQIDGVQLYSIHKSKGLEAEVIICPLLDRSQKSVSMWVDSGEAVDETDKKLTSAYVKMTKNTGPTDYDKEYAEEVAMGEFDELNTLYVALTRPREQLFVYYQVPTDPEKARHRPCGLLAGYVGSEEGMSKCGDPDYVHEAKDKAKDGEEVKVVTPERVSFGSWADKIKVSSKLEETLGDHENERVRFGNMAHDILSTIVSVDDADRALKRYMEAHRVDDATRRRLENIVGLAMQQPESRRFFRTGVQVLNERWMVVGGELRRPDRVIVDADGVEVVDFKTGHPEQAHADQVREYCDILGKMGYRNVRGYLLYMTDSVEVQPVL